MSKQVNIQVSPKFIKRYYNGYPLVLAEALENKEELTKEGAVFNLIDTQERVIAKAYYGIQNKGIGWVLTQDPNEQIDMAFFKNKLQAALDKRSIFFKSSKTNAFRVFNGEGDGIGGLIIDYFDGYYVLNWYSRGIYQYRDHVINNLKKMVDFKGIYQKRRYEVGGKFIDEDGFVMGERGEFPLLVKENDVQFAVYLNEGAMVGVFLDQRDVRKRIRDKYAEGRTVLNTFSYTGAFSVFAALGGAARTTSVDVANRSYGKTIEQFSVNGIDFDAHDILVEDVFNYFKYAQKKNLKYGMVILDPPSFARTDKFKFAAEQDYKDLLKDAISITEEQGIIVASTNCSAFDMKKFMIFIDEAFKESGCSYKVLESHALPRDFVTSKQFKEGNYLKVVFIEKI